jgi:serine/threonine protein kinase
VDTSKLVLGDTLLGGRAHLLLADYDGRRVVAKEFRVGEAKGLVECSAYEAVHCSNMLDSFGHCQLADKHGEDFVYLLLEYAEHGSLGTLCKRPVNEEERTADGIDVSLLQRVTWLRHTALALLYLHEQRMLHRDIKPDNVMVREDMTAALGDLEFALRLEQEPVADLTASLGTSGFVAPEVLAGEGPHTCASDVYSFGVTVVGVLVGPIYPTRALLLSQVEQLCVDCPQYASHLALLRAISEHCTRRTPGRRPTAQELCTWFERMLAQWDVLESMRLHATPAVRWGAQSCRATAGEKGSTPVDVWLQGG